MQFSMLRVFSKYILFFVVGAVFIWTVQAKRNFSQPKLSEEMSVRLPLPLQLSSSFGDRYLAANIGVIRAILLGTGQLDESTTHVLGQVQVDAATFNPFHVDNYYLAAAILPWSDEVAPAIFVLEKATNSRLKDELPPFYLGFITQQFYQDYAKAGQYAVLASQRATGQNKMALQAIAAKWYEKTVDTQLALQVLESMKQQSKDSAFQAFIQSRIERVKILILLQIAAREFKAKVGHQAHELSDLIGYAGLSEIPSDPTGVGYGLDSNGAPILLNRKIQK